MLSGRLIDCTVVPWLSGYHRSVQNLKGRFLHLVALFTRGLDRLRHVGTKVPFRSAQRAHPRALITRFLRTCSAIAAITCIQGENFSDRR